MLFDLHGFGTAENIGDDRGVKRFVFGVVADDLRFSFVAFGRSLKCLFQQGDVVFVEGVDELFIDFAEGLKPLKTLNTGRDGKAVLEIIPENGGESGVGVEAQLTAAFQHDPLPSMSFKFARLPA